MTRPKYVFSGIEISETNKGLVINDHSADLHFHGMKISQVRDEAITINPAPRNLVQQLGLPAETDIDQVIKLIRELKASSADQHDNIVARSGIAATLLSSGISAAGLLANVATIADSAIVKRILGS